MFMYSYVLTCDCCGARGEESRRGQPFFIPAGWYLLMVKRTGYTDAEVAFCPECWEHKTCKEAFSEAPWRRL